MADSGQEQSSGLAEESSAAPVVSPSSVTPPPARPRALTCPATPSPAPRSRKTSTKFKEALKKTRDGIADMTEQVAQGTKRVFSRGSTREPSEGPEQRAAMRQSSWARRPPFEKLKTPSEPVAGQASTPATKEHPSASTEPGPSLLLSPPIPSPLPVRTPKKKQHFISAFPTTQISPTPSRLGTTTMPALPKLPGHASSPSALETVLFCHGLGVALQARTVPQGREQPADCSEPYHEDLLAPWPCEEHTQLSSLDPETIKLGILKAAHDDYRQDQSDTRLGYNYRQHYEQRYLPLDAEEPGAVLARKWNDSVRSRTGLVPDLVRIVSGVPVLWLLPVRIQMGTFKNAPVKTVLLVDMALHHWLPKEQSLQIAYQCKAVITQYNFNDVEVEVRAVPSRIWEKLSDPRTLGNDLPEVTERGDLGQPQRSPQPAEIFPLLKKQRLECLRFINERADQLDEPVFSIAEEALSDAGFSPIFAEVGTIGLQISSHKSQGSMGPILRLLASKQNPERTLGLTCNHVVQRRFQQRDWPPLHEDYMRGNQDQNALPLPLDMQLFAPKKLDRLRGLESAVESIKIHIQHEEDALRRVLRTAQTNEELEQFDLRSAQQKENKAALEMLEKVRNAIPQECPKVGTVFAAGAYGTVVNIPATTMGPDHMGEPPLRFLPDWALLEFDPSFLAARSESELNACPWLTWPNRLRTQHRGLLDEARVRDRLKGPSQYGRRSVVRDPDSERHSFYKVSGTSEPFSPHVSRTVFKDGATTGFTMGDTVGALAVLPRGSPSQAENTIWTTELAVVSRNNETGFSLGGDSGSAVIDAECRVVGILVRGVIPTDNKKQDEYTRARERFNELVTDPVSEFHDAWLVGQLQRHINQDISFVTPIQPILEDIQRVTGQRAEIA